MADLTVTLTESFTLNGREHGGSKAVNIGACTEVMKRTVTCKSSADTIVAFFDDTPADTASAVDIQGTKYFRLTNLDAQYVTVSLWIDIAEDSSAEDTMCSFKLAPNQSWIFGTMHDSFAVDDDTDGGGLGVLTDFDDIIKVSVKPSSGTALVEVFTAGTRTS